MALIHDTNGLNHLNLGTLSEALQRFSSIGEYDGPAKSQTPVTGQRRARERPSDNELFLYRFSPLPF